MKYLERQYLFFYAWFSFITYASVTPNENIPDIHLFAHFDKVVHFFMYLGLSFLLMASIFKTNNKSMSFWFSFFSASIIGGLFELVQKYITFDRSASWLDLIANIAGSLIGVLLFKFLISKSKFCRFIFKNE